MIKSTDSPGEMTTISVLYGSTSFPSKATTINMCYNEEKTEYILGVNSIDKLEVLERSQCA